MPVIDPVELEMARPAGRPEAVHVNVAPDWVSEAELESAVMADPVTFDLAPGLVTVTVLVIVQVKVAEPAKEAPSVAVMVTE